MTDPKPYASPACYAHETDPEYAGFLGGEEVLTLLAEAHRLVVLTADRPTLQSDIETLITRLGGTIPTPPEDTARQDAAVIDRLRKASSKIAEDDVHLVLCRVLDGL